jgi:O-antigen/teichoic acid export membrane protein
MHGLAQPVTATGAQDTAPVTSGNNAVGSEGSRPIEQRAFRVSFVNGVSTILTMVFQFVAVPVCLRFWGAEKYGNWLALLSAFMLIRSLDGGFVIYVGNKLNYLYHTSAGMLRRHLASAVFGVVVTGSLQLVIASTAALFPLVAARLNLTAGDTAGTHEQFGLLLLTVSWVLTGSYPGLVHRLLIPTGLMYQAAWWAMAFQVCQFAAIMIAAGLNLDMLQTSALFAFTQALIYVASALYVRVRLPQFVPWLQGASPRLAATDFIGSLALSASNIIQQASTNGAVLLVAALIGAAAVPIFTTVRTLANLWTAVTTVLTAPMLPEVVRLHATGQAQKLSVINESYWTLVGSTVNLGTLLIFPALPFFYEHWTGRAVALDHSLMSLMLAAVIIANAGGLIAVHLNGLNRLAVVLGASLARAVAGLGGGALLVGKLGLAGVGLGILVGEALATVLLTRTFVNDLRTDGVSMTLASLGPVVLSTASALSYFVSTALAPRTGVTAWLAAVAGCAAAAVWGWNRMDPELRTRLKLLPRRLINSN